MKAKLPWVVVAVLALVSLGSLAALAQARAARRHAEVNAELAQKAKADGEAAVAKALAAREAAESEKLKLDAAKKVSDDQLAAAQSALTVAKQELADQKTNGPKLEAEVASARRALADLQRSNPVATAPKEEVRAAIEIPHRAPGGWSVPDMLPPDTLGLITFRDVPSAITKVKETGLYKILTHPDFERVFSKQLGQVRGVVFAGEVMLGQKASELLSFVSQGEITLAVLGVDKRLPNGAPLADVMLSLELRDKASAFIDEFNKRLDQLKSATSGNLQYTQAPLGNTTVTRFKYAEFPGELCCAMCDGTFLMCLGEGRLEKLMAMHQKMKSGLTKVEAEGPEVLAQTQAFKTAVEKAGPDADALAFVNVDAIQNNVIINDPNKELNPTQKHELELSGLREVKAFSYSSGIQDKGVHENIFIDVPVTRRKGLLGLLDGEGADLNAFYAAPRNAVLAWTFKLNPEQLLEKAVAIAAMDNPQAPQNIATVLLLVGQTLKVDPQKDILGALTGQGVFSLNVPGKNSKLAVAMPQPILTLKIKDQESVKTLSKALVAYGQEKLEFVETSESGKTITVARERERPNDGIHQFCFVVDGDDLLFSIYPLALREEIKRRAGKGERLDDDAEFNRARANISGQPQALVYLDAGAIAAAAYEVLVPIAQVQMRDPQIDINALPSGELLSRNLGGAIVNLKMGADGIMFEGYSPSGLFSFLVPAAIGAKMAQNRNAAQNNADGVAAAAPPAMAAQPRNAADQKKVDILEKLARDLKEFSQEHGGEFPKKLDEMRPKYLQDMGKDVEHIVFLGKQPGENKVVAHSSEKLAGNIAILTQNGSVKSIQRGALGKVLREGYLDANTAVKPPKPPEF